MHGLSLNELLKISTKEFNLAVRIRIYKNVIGTSISTNKYISVADFIRIMLLTD